MKPTLLILAALTGVVLVQAQPVRQPEPPLPRDSAAIIDGQRLYGPAAPAAPVAQTAPASPVRSLTPSGAAPRIVLTVNRGIFDPAPGATEPDAGAKPGAAEAPVATIADQLTVREIEFLFGRVFRASGAVLIDRAAALSQAGLRPSADNLARQREALAASADIVIEVLISSRSVTMPGISQDRVVSIPDILATAIRLSDSAIVGQANASDVVARGRAGAIDVRGVTEATALALQQDMLASPVPAVAASR